MNDPKIKRHALPPDTVKNDVTKVVYKLNLDINNRIAATEDRPAEVVYNVPGEKTYLHYVDDHLLGFPYVAFSGKGADGLSKEFAELFPVLTKKDVDDLLAKAGDDEVKLERALGSAFVIAPETYSAGYMKYFNKAFKHDSADMRRYGVLGVGYVGWPELQEPLQKLAESDPDEDVQNAAKQMLAAMKRAGKR